MKINTDTFFNYILPPLVIVGALTCSIIFSIKQIKERTTMLENHFNSIEMKLDNIANKLQK